MLKNSWPALQQRIADRRTVIFGLLGGLALCVAGGGWTASYGETSARRVKQGDVFAFSVGTADLAGSSDTNDITVRFGDRDWPVFATADGVGALIGVDLETEPGTYAVELARRAERGSAVLVRGSVIVETGDFGVQTLTLPDKQVDLDADTLRRVTDEQHVMLGAMEDVTPMQWNGSFVLPTDGPLQHTFGRRRVINGQPRRPHSGEDISAPAGTTVAAINHGVVRLVDEQFFAGKCVVVDHGLGLYSMYFHLSETGVQVGERVAKNQVIGKVGATGRVSGAHLHWGVRLNGARVNPLSLNAALTGLVVAAK